jgi:hypothetical protein
VSRKLSWGAAAAAIVVLLGVALVHGQARDYGVVLRVRPEAAVSIGDKKKDDTKETKSDSWIKLFNGKDLTGWTVFLDPRKKDADPKKIFTVQDGIIVCEGSVFGYAVTDKEYGDYVLTLKWRWGKRLPEKGVPNSGVFVHVAGPDKIWPKAVEAQLMSGHAGDFWLVDGFKLKVDPKRQDPKVDRHYFRLETTKPVEYPVGEWNTYVITCKGDHVRLEINGQLVNEGTMAEINRGKILLQSEGAEIHFKDVMLKAVK